MTGTSDDERMKTQMKHLAPEEGDTTFGLTPPPSSLMNTDFSQER